VMEDCNVSKEEMEEKFGKEITFLNPFLPFEAKALAETILELPEFEQYHFTKKNY